jgi:ribosomal protein S18 acetylase RimI-like enzyme
LVACGLGVLHDDLLGIFDVITVASQRRRGYGAALMAGLIGWGIARGAAHAYLQVVRSNAPAMALYERLGFTKAYEYWYRVRGSTS